jgi:selenocysteine-specific elongation factor
MDVIVGTAGHIDHGKTALIKALTGVDADRLPEEKQRGITIDLGFAEMRDEDVHIGFVDVPGHERFVKNMLAGASGIDLVLLVVAADEGVMPQTREHFDICRLLRIKSGIIVLTKTDIADEEMIELAKLDVAELVKDSFLENAPVAQVSSRTGVGIQDLKDELKRAAGSVVRDEGRFEARLPIDRSFSIKGFGAVVTGTLSHGDVDEGDELDLMPTGRRVRIRGIQAHGKSVTRAHTGQRTALNIAGANHDEITRGMVLAVPGSLSVTQVLDAEIEVLADSPRSIKSRQRVRLHLGAAEVLARVVALSPASAIEPGTRGMVQLRLESPVATAHADRFVLRSYSPQRTIAGGRVLDPVASRHRRADLSSAVSLLGELSEAADAIANVAEIMVRMAGRRGKRPDEIRSRSGLRHKAMDAAISDAIREKKIVDADGVLVSASAFDQLTSATLKTVETHHLLDKLSRGISRETLREQVFKHSEPEVFRTVTAALQRDGKIVFDQDVFKLSSHETHLSPAETKAHDTIRKIYTDAGLEVPKLDDVLRDASDVSGLDAKSTRKIFQLFVTSGELVQVSSEFYFTAVTLNALAAKLRESAKASGDLMLDVARFKALAGVSRKYAIPLLEYFDRSHVTRRVGDKRQILG